MRGARFLNSKKPNYSHRVLINPSLNPLREDEVKGCHMDELEFDALIKRCLSGQATEQEIELVEKWLEQRQQNDPFGKLSVNEKEKIRIKIFKSLSSKMMDRDVSVAKTRLPVRAIVFYRAAAAILLLCVFSYIAFEFAGNPGVEKVTVIHSVSSADASKKIILSDSSIVWLKGNSTILYPEKFDGKERNVKLTGEALFEVSKDPEHPFVIECGGLIAKVLGTSFNIKSSETDIEVFVLTGKVALTSRGNDSHLIVLPNEKAVYNESQNQMAKVKANEDEKIVKTQGTQYSMKFHATPIREIIRKIEGKFDVRVKLSDERLGNCTITADFTDQSLDKTLSMIAQTLEIEYEINNREVMLKGVGCD